MQLDWLDVEKFSRLFITEFLLLGIQELKISLPKFTNDKFTWLANYIVVLEILYHIELSRPYHCDISSFSFSISATIASTLLVLNSFMGVSCFIIATSRFFPCTTSNKARTASLITWSSLAAISGV